MTATRERDRSAGVVAVAGEALVEAAPGGRPANVAVGPDHAARAMLQRLLARTRDAIAVLVSMGGCIAFALTDLSAVEVVGAVLGTVSSRTRRGLGAVAAR